ncbi:MAG TPA: hypothetical protein VE344_06710 [Methylomirabilota bacterium]|nr:hypothetical protein [Methylomirabilota bacterium]
MRLRILLPAGAILLIAAYAVIHCFLLPPESFPPIITFQTYLYSSDGKQYAIAAINNNDSCAYAFHEKFEAIIDKTNCWYVIHSSLANQTIAPNSSSIGIFNVPPHSSRWVVESVATKCTFMERNFSWLFRTNKFDEYIESGWIP